MSDLWKKQIAYGLHLSGKLFGHRILLICILWLFLYAHFWNGRSLYIIQDSPVYNDVVEVNSKKLKLIPIEFGTN